MQTPRTMAAGSSTPASTAGMKSDNSTHEWAAANTSGSVFRQCQTLAQNHSDE